jgi:hypothetical protein
LRIFPPSHTNPVFVLVDGKPVRTSMKSARWCLKAVRKEEQGDAGVATDRAREEYRKMLAESAVGGCLCSVLTMMLFTPWPTRRTGDSWFPVAAMGPCAFGLSPQGSKSFSGTARISAWFMLLPFLPMGKPWR